MEKELDPEVIKATQSSLGKYVKRPPLTEKLLKKPPFRFLHDIVTTVLKTTGFFEGLFEEEELISENVKDRDSKVLFLTKVISVLGLATGKSLAAKPSKIVAGQEPDKTNELLQCIAIALDQKLSSEEAVQKYKEKGKSSQLPEKKSSKPAKPINDVKKLTSRSSEKLTTNKRDLSKERSINKNEKEKVVTKPKQKESSTVKKESPPKKTSSQTKTITKKNSVEKISQQQDATKQTKSNPTTSRSEIDGKESEIIASDDRNGKDSGVSSDKQDIIESTNGTQQLQNMVKESQELNSSSYIIAENDLNSSLSSQDLMETDNEKIFNVDENPNSEKEINNVTNVDLGIEQVHSTEPTLSAQVLDKTKSRSVARTNSDDVESLPKDKTTNYENNSVAKVEQVTRPASVRPSSSRPGAPRLRDKHETVLPGNDNLVVGKVNIITEHTPNEEDEDNSIVIVEQHSESVPTSSDQDQMHLSSDKHGHLVQQILESQKEYSHVAGKTEIEWQFGAQKAREAIDQEIEQLRFNIQALSRVANPLGKLLDHIQEDVEVMRQELQQWTKTYEEAIKELLKQKTANEDSLLPLHTKLKQLDVDIEEKRDKISDLKIVIHKNSTRIEKLLANGDVQ